MGIEIWVENFGKKIAEKIAHTENRYYHEECI